MEEDRSAFKTLTDKRIGKRPFGRYGRRWEDNIRMDLKEVYITTRIWVDLTRLVYWRALVNAAFNLQVS